MPRLLSLLGPRRLLILAVLIVLSVQAAFWIPAARTHGFASSDAGVKLWQVQSMVRTGRLDAPIDYPGAIYDSEHQYSPFVPPWFFWQDGQPYSEYTSPFLWISAPLYMVLGHKGLLILPGVSGALLVIMAAWLVWRVRKDYWAALAPIVIGFSSPLLIYSIEFWEHASGAALAMFALIGIVKAVDSRHRPLWLIAAGAAIGLGLTMRAELYVYPVAVVMGFVLLRSARRVPFLRSLMWLAGGGLLTAGPWWLYQLMRWGNPLGPRVAQNVPGLGGSEMLKRLGDTTGRNWTMLVPSAGSGIDLLAVLGVVVLLIVIARIFAKPVRLKRVLFWLQASSVIAMTVILLWRLANWSTALSQRPDDLLTTFPLVLLLLLTLPLKRAEGAVFPLADFLLIVGGAFVALVVLVSPFQGGVQWGPRFLLPALVPLTVAGVDRAARWQHSADRSLRVGLAATLSALVLLGGYSTWLGAQFTRDGQNSNAQLQQAISSLPEHVVVADAWFIPQGAPYTFGDKLWLMAESKKSMYQLLQMLRKTTSETSVIYLSSPYWAHVDPQAIMGPRIALIGDPPDTSQFVTLARYLLLR